MFSLASLNPFAKFAKSPKPPKPLRDGQSLTASFSGDELPSMGPPGQKPPDDPPTTIEP